MIGAKRMEGTGKVRGTWVSWVIDNANDKRLSQGGASHMALAWICEPRGPWHGSCSITKTPLLHEHEGQVLAQAVSSPRLNVILFV